jgi:hypothetical protein
MFNFLKLAAMVTLKPVKLDDPESCKKFLIDLIRNIKPLAAKSDTQLDDIVLKYVEYVLNNDALFDYVYKLLFDQLSTDDILFESADEDTIFELCENTVPSTTEYPESLNPIVIVSLISQIISIINAIKNK